MDKNIASYLASNPSLEEKKNNTSLQMEPSTKHWVKNSFHMVDSPKISNKEKIQPNNKHNSEKELIGNNSALDTGKGETE